MLLIITSTGDRLFRFINIDDFEWPWTLKILILSDFLAIFGCKRVNCDKMDGDRLRLPANRNCCRLSRVSWALLKLLVVSADICAHVHIFRIFSSPICLSSGCHHILFVPVIHVVLFTSWPLLSQWPSLKLCNISLLNCSLVICRPLLTFFLS